MTKKLCIRTAVISAFVGILGASGLAAAQVAEVEPNDTINTPQRLTIRGADGVTVQGSISSNGEADFYSFKAKAGDMVTIDIDGGMTTDEIGLHSTLSLYGPMETGPIMLRSNAQTRKTDDGSISIWDARLDSVLLGADGTYVVVVAGFPTVGVGGGGVDNNKLPFDINSIGNYTLIITGATPGPSVQAINIDVKPGDRSMASPINMKSNGRIPVALLSSADFDPSKVKQDTLRFGHDGTEISLARCSRDKDDFNKDGLPDLVCQFNTQSTLFLPTDTEGVLTGQLQDGTQIEGRGALKVIPADERHHHHGGHDRDGHDRDGHDHGDHDKDDHGKGKH